MRRVKDHRVTIGREGGKHKTVTFDTFDGVADLADYVEGALSGTRYMTSDFGNASFYGGGFEKAKTHVREGDASMVKASDKIVALIEDRVGFVSSRFANLRAVSGGAPNIPAMLSGHPKTMRRRKKVVTEDAPLAIIADIVSSGGVDTETIKRRGAALMALARILEATRPVTLYACTGQRQSGTSYMSAIRISTGPLDLARASWVLGSPQMTRRVAFALSEDAAGSYGGGSVQWCFNSYEWQTRHLPAAIAEAMGVTDYVASSGVMLGTTFGSDEAAADWVLERANELQGRKAA